MNLAGGERRVKREQMFYKAQNLQRITLKHLANTLEKTTRIRQSFKLHRSNLETKLKEANKLCKRTVLTVLLFQDTLYISRLIYPEKNSAIDKPCQKF